MKLQQGDMWSAFDTADLFLITTNASIKRNGALVMGRGIAQQARDRFPGLDKALGREIRNGETYGLLVSRRWPDAKIGAFQVKYNFQDKASLALIDYAVTFLDLWCRGHLKAQVHLNYPGIGNGKLDKAQVAPIIERLPDTVTVWYL